MCDEARSFHTKDEIGRRFRGPFLKTGRALERIKGAVDLDRAELTAGKLQLALLRMFRRIKNAAPWLIRPTRNADAERAGTICRVRYTSLNSAGFFGSSFCF